MRVLAPITLLAGVLLVSLIGEVAARDVGDLAESDFRSQAPPNYTALERLQRTNLGLAALGSRPDSPAVRTRRRRHPG